MMLDFSHAGLSGQYVSLAYFPPLTARTLIATVVAGPIPDDLTTLAIVIQRKDSGSEWHDAGGLSTNGNGSMTGSTSYLNCTPGVAFRVFATIVGGLVPVTLTTAVQ